MTEQGRGALWKEHSLGVMTVSEWGEGFWPCTRPADTRPRTGQAQAGLIDAVVRGGVACW